MKPRDLFLATALIEAGVLGLPATTQAAEPSQPVKPAISDEASAALEQMGKNGGREKRPCSLTCAGYAPARVKAF